MESARRCFGKFLSKDKPPNGMKKGVTSNGKEWAKVHSAATKQRVDAAKQYIEKHCKEQIKNLQQRKERENKKKPTVSPGSWPSYNYRFGYNYCEDI